MRLSPVWIAPLLLVGCSSAPPEIGTYPLDIAAATARLAHADDEGFRAARQCGILIHLDQQPSASGFSWQVSSSGFSVLRFSVVLAAIDASRSRATIDVPADPQGGEVYDGTKQYARPAVSQPLRPAVQELIDAAMDQRPFDGSKLGAIDSQCALQRSGLKSGAQLRYDDKPTNTDAAARRAREQDDQDAAKLEPTGQDAGQ